MHCKAKVKKTQTMNFTLDIHGNDSWMYYNLVDGSKRIIEHEAVQQPVAVAVAEPVVEAKPASKKQKLPTLVVNLPSEPTEYPLSTELPTPRVFIPYDDVKGLRKFSSKQAMMYAFVMAYLQGKNIQQKEGFHMGNPVTVFDETTPEHFLDFLRIFMTYSKTTGSGMPRMDYHRHLYVTVDKLQKKYEIDTDMRGMLFKFVGSITKTIGLYSCTVGSFVLSSQLAMTVDRIQDAIQVHKEMSEDLDTGCSLKKRRI